MMTKKGIFSTDSEHFKLLKAKFTDRLEERILSAVLYV
jgi:hypothetical protein